MKRPASRASLMSRMRALLRGYLLTHARLTHWKPRTVDKLDLGCVTLTECGDLCAAKYLLSLSKDQFKALMLERAKLKAKKTAVARGKKDGTEKDAKAELKAERQRVQKICMELIKGKGFAKVSYSFCAPKSFGRRFARGGQQGVWGPFSCALMSGKCSDFDMVNAHPVILLWVCDSLKIRCPKLRYYVNYRDDVLEQMMRHTGKSRQFCKEQFLVSTNDEKPVFQKNTFDFLVEYDVEMKSVIHPSLTGQPEYQWLRTYLVDRDNFNGCFVNLILCYWENIILEYAFVYFQEQDIVPRVLKFDGLLVSKAGTDEQAGPVELNARESAWHCKMLRALCMHVLNINMKWTEKPLNDTTGRDATRLPTPESAVPVRRDRARIQ